MNKIKYQPKSKNELIEVIKKEIYQVQGTPNNPNWEANLNCIDTSNITDMSYLFKRLNKFNGDISQWNISNVKDMSGMFICIKFNQDISQWDVSNVESMSGMFCCSRFNQDISKWDISNVKDMSGMFCCSVFNQDISKWDVSKVENMNFMFYASVFNQDISNWNVSNVENMFKKTNKGN